MKILIKIFLTILPALYLGNAMGDDKSNTFKITGNISESNTSVQIKLDSGCKIKQANDELLSNKYIQNTFTETVVCPKKVTQVTYTLTPGNTRTHKLTGKSTDKLKNTDGANYKLGTIKLRAIDTKTAAASPTNTPTPSKNTPKETSLNEKNRMKQNALKDFCVTIPLVSKLADGKINEQCDPQNPTITIICYKTNKEINQDRLKKRYNNYCFSNKENSVFIEQYTEQSCTEEELQSLNAISCTKYNDGEDTNFLDIECDNTNYAIDYSERKCIPIQHTHSLSFNIENNPQNIPLNISVYGNGDITCIADKSTITNHDNTMTVKCTKGNEYRMFIKTDSKDAEIDTINGGRYRGDLWIKNLSPDAGNSDGHYIDVNDDTPIVIKLKSSSDENAEDQVSDDANKEDAKVAPVVTDPNTPAPNDPRWSEEEIDAARDAAESARETENSDVNKLLGSVGMGATGIGGMMLMQGLSEKAADDDATRAMQAYISTFNCTYGSNRVAGGTVAEIPGGNELIALYSEYVNLANNLKSVKNELDMRAGIESEPILDSATSGLYDDVSVGGTSGAYASLARALMNPNGTDAAAWAEQTEKTSKNITTGAITAGAGAGVSMIGDLTNKLVEKKKAEKSTKSK